jgi:low affinity Fe/Cu permease
MSEASHSKQHEPKASVLEHFAHVATQWTGTSHAFLLAFAIVVIWALTGPIFHYSENWQLVINTGTTIITFLMVFIIQRSQNKESLAVQLKLNEIVAALRGASNRLISIENLSEEDLEKLQARYAQLVKLANQDPDDCRPHSVDESVERERSSRRK